MNVTPASARRRTGKDFRSLDLATELKPAVAVTFMP
jgi:hypothetical protein